MEKYYLIVFVFTPYMCQPIHGMAVLSEHPLDVIRRTNDKHKKYSGNFIITQFNEIDREFYDQYKDMNPTSEHYVRLNDNDFVQRNAG